ncbi:hypothetical protein FOZ62_000963 [Perkinsus olseni]|uniref:Uncharacterized protein n=1 Tax=Perkinsus olseni TaxID=32597 RepID=A0A7J6RM89_PEROL|nr:hypothetical protein FOZ62_000963 [Perkinsus olseni]
MVVLEKDLQRQVEELKALTIHLKCRVEALEAGQPHDTDYICPKCRTVSVGPSTPQQGKRARERISSGSASTRSSPRASADASPCAQDSPVVGDTPATPIARKRRRRRPDLKGTARGLWVLAFTRLHCSFRANACLALDGSCDNLQSPSDEGVRKCELIMVQGVDAHVVSRIALVWVRKSVFGCFHDCQVFKELIEADPNCWEFSARDGKDGERREVGSRERVIEVIRDFKSPVIIAREICTIEDSECESCEGEREPVADGGLTQEPGVQDWMLLD